MSILSSIARIFQRPAYTSEITHVIEEMKQQKPDLEMRQWLGRARLWDVIINRARQKKFQLGRVPQQAYVYQTGSDYDAPEPQEDVI